MHDWGMIQASMLTIMLPKHQSTQPIPHAVVSHIQLLGTVHCYYNKNCDCPAREYIAAMICDRPACLASFSSRITATEPTPDHMMTCETYD